MPDRQDGDDARPMDPVALTLAVWLGLIVGVTGMIRLSDNAAALSAMAQKLQEAAPSAEAQNPFNPRLMAFGG